MERRIVPFYMAYPLPVNYQDEQEMVRDMEYLQSQHSMEIRQLRKHIADTINIMDSEGSMIYDEYPDRFSMERQSKMISENLKKTYEDDESCAFHKMLFWDGFEDIVRLLVYDEILKRRHRRKKGYLQF